MRQVPSAGTEPDFLDIVERFGKTGYWHIELQSERIFFSNEVCEIHEMPPGYRPESIEECTNWFHPDDIERVASAVKLAGKDGKPFSFEARLLTAARNVRWVEVRGELRSDAMGFTDAILGTMKDVSEAREMNDRLVDALREAKCANRLKDTFLANMSHELRTPLNAIIGFSQIISMMKEQGNVDEKVGGYATDIASAGSHLLAIIEDIFSLAQMEAEAENLQIAPVSIGSLLDDVRSLTGTISREYKRKVSFDPAQCAQARILVDKDKMTKIMVNLVSNAIKFSQPGAPIRVGAEFGAGGRVIVKVKDQGPGIPEHLHERIFERFERLEASKHAIEGIGVGLAIARDLVTSMGGEIGVNSVAGEGSTFWLAFDHPDQAPLSVVA